MRHSKAGARQHRLALLPPSVPGESDTPDRISGTELVNYAGDIEAFASACGARLPLRLRVTDERTGESEELSIEKPYAVVGSAELCDVRLVHPDVSRHHVYIQILEGRALCCDLGSRTGTHWGTAIRSRNWMEYGEPVHIGPFSLRLIRNEVIQSGATALSSRRLESRVGRPTMLLTFLNARSRSGRTRVSRVRNPITLVGWSHLCNLRLQHHSVGRVHCSLVWTESGLWAVDLLCAGGTFVKGVPVSYARLDDDDNLAIGRFELKIAYGSAAEIPIQAAADVGDPILTEFDEITSPEGGPPRKGIGVEPPAEMVLVPRAELRPRPAAPLPVTAEDRPIPTRPAAVPVEVSPMPELAGAGVSDSVAVSLMQQFASMQQQMFDHTQQLLTVMAETFQAAHSRQMDIIREELERVHELNRELRELNRQRSEGRDTALAEIPAEMLTDRMATESVSRAPGQRTLPLAEIREPVVEEPTAQPLSAAADSTASVPPAVSAEAAGAASPQPEGAVPPAPKRRAPREEPVGAKPATAAPGTDVHTWLSGRINELERERTSRWQRILQLLTQSTGGS